MEILNPIECIKNIWDKLKSEEQKIKQELNELKEYLEGSEYLLIELMVDNKIWEGAVPPKPSSEGSYEFGLIPYWFNNPPRLLEDLIQENEIVEKLLKRLQKEFITTNIDKENYDRLMERITEEEGISGYDGTLFGTGKYEQFDVEWLYMLLNHFKVKFTGKKAQFPVRTTYEKVALAGQDPDVVRIGIVGDWGTGEYKDGNTKGPAHAIIEQIVNMNPRPDYLIHLGDVYYTGAGADFRPENEVKQKFVDLWPSTDKLPAGRSFNLNSNHDMVSGSLGYFNEALADERFSSQQGYSYFALEFGGWTIVGLDSAYFDKSVYYMQGSIGGTSSAQAKWLKNLKLNPEKTIVMTHHNPTDQTGAKLVNKGKNKKTLWKEIIESLGGHPGIWYWGHLHNGIVYKTPNFDGSNTKCRCIGHSAIPFGNAFALQNEIENNPNNFIEYYAHTPDKRFKGEVRVLNGFSMLNIYKDGKIEEQVYEVTNPKPVWSLITPADNA